MDKAMENLFNPDTICTDPDNLQFCLKLSETEFWYCEPNIYNELIYIENTIENLLYERYKGYPHALLADTLTDHTLKAFCTNRLLWLYGEIDVNEIPIGERIQLLKDYGYTWNSFKSGTERNQIICENYFEQSPMDFRNDI